ncbi:MAG: crossover junction endodeoxyribonuclease RuvC [Candidatus Kapaibacterium sp.]|jgi:crossover junction endodeoxyribonuclease RuvC
MIILGVDPGTLVTGYGVVETKGSGANKITMIEYGTIQSGRASSLPLRLETIFRGLEEVIERTKPDAFAIETAFYDKNVQSTLKLGHARGVAILAAVLRQIPTSEFSPREVKKAVVGNGNADKKQVEFMVRRMLALPEKEMKLSDAYDALAVALTHAFRSTRIGTGSWKNWEQFVNENPGRVKGATTKKSLIREELLKRDVSKKVGSRKTK